MQLVEKYFISSNNEFYPLLDNLSFKAKNLYNYVNYHIRQSYTAAKKLRTGEILSSVEKYQLKLVNDKILKHGKKFNYSADFSSMELLSDSDINLGFQFKYFIPRMHLLAPLPQ